MRSDSLLLEAARTTRKSDFTLDYKLFAEGEWWPYLAEFSNELVKLEAQPELKGRVLVECQVVDFLQLVHDRGANIPVFLYATAVDAQIDSASARGFTGITISNDLVSAAQVADIKRRGLAVALFGVGAFGQGDAIAKKPDRLQTDAPSSFVK